MFMRWVAFSAPLETSWRSPFVHTSSTFQVLPAGLTIGHAFVFCHMTPRLMELVKAMTLHTRSRPSSSVVSR